MSVVINEVIVPILGIIMAATACMMFLGICIAALWVLVKTIQHGGPPRETNNRPVGMPHPIINLTDAMASLCSAVQQLDPEWKSIEITRQGGRNVGMKIVGSNGEEVDPSKMH